MTRAEARQILIAAFKALTPKQRARLYRRREAVTCFGSGTVVDDDGLSYPRYALYSDGKGG